MQEDRVRGTCLFISREKLKHRQKEGQRSQWSRILKFRAAFPRGGRRRPEGPGLGEGAIHTCGALLPKPESSGLPAPSAGWGGPAPGHVSAVPPNFSFLRLCFKELKWDEKRAVQWVCDHLRPQGPPEELALAALSAGTRKARPGPAHSVPFVSPGLVQIPVSMYQTVVTSLAQGNGPVQVAMAPVTTRISDSTVTMDGQAVEVVTLEE